MAEGDALQREVVGEEADTRGEDLWAQGLERLLSIEPEERALRRLVSALAEAVPSADSAALLLPSGHPLEIVAAVGLDEGTPEMVSGGMATEVGNRLLQRRDPGPPFPRGTRCGAAIPLRPLTGAVLLLGSRSAERFDAGALALLRAAADRAEIALDRSRLERERDAAAEDARRTHEDAASRRKAVDFILGIVGHDLRNPLGAVHMSAALIQKRGGLEGWQARAVERIRSSTGRMSRIIADLLSYTRTRLGNGIPIERRQTRLDEVARRAVDELRAGNPEREITIDVEGEPSGEWDPDRLEQVVSNLVSNAIDHGDPAPIRVEIAQGEDRCTVRVRNRGPHVPAEVLAHLFEPFSRPPDEKCRKGSGLGLGLFISREIIRAHGGEVHMTSGEETVITVSLPVRPPPA